MPSCCVPNCKSRTENGFRLFRIPSNKRNKERTQIWLKFINRNRLPLSATVCEAHFEDSQFECHRADNRKLLKWNAIPTIKVYQCNNVKEEIHAPSRFINICDDNFNKHSNSTDSIKVWVYQSLSPKNQATDEYNGKKEVDETLEFTGIYDNNSQNDPLSLNETKDEAFITNLRLQSNTKLQNAYKKIYLLKGRIKKMEKMYKELFNEDQVTLLTKGIHGGTEWSTETLKKSLKLYTTCGARGYEEILNQNLPYPSIHMLQLYLKNFKAGITEPMAKFLDTK